MASRKAQKDQRRREREEAELLAQRAARRRTRQLAGAVGVAVVATVVSVLVLVMRIDDRETLREQFAAEPRGLAQRMARADLARGSDHFHPILKVYVNGQQVAVPDDIGVGEDGVTAPLHRHPGDEMLHAEGAREGELTLGQVMAVWGLPFSPQRLGPKRASRERRVQVWVKSPEDDRFTETHRFSALLLRDRQEIYVAYGTRAESPIVQ